jgi:hypothetical protein
MSVLGFIIGFANGLFWGAVATLYLTRRTTPPRPHPDERGWPEVQSDTARLRELAREAKYRGKGTNAEMFTRIADNLSLIRGHQNG